MSFYVVVEGTAEKRIYKTWIPLVNSALIYEHDIANVGKDNYYIVSGKGFPHYFSTIENAIEDVNEWKAFNRLVIAVDSEEMSREEKLIELQEFLSEYKCRVVIKIIIQHFCIESWLLGNRKIIRDNPHSIKLREYKRFFNVRKKDPELLPGYPIEDLNRAQFAFRYLKLALKDKHKKLYYSKASPHPVCHTSYLEQLKKRLDETEHIASFETFMDAFSPAPTL